MKWLVFSFKNILIGTKTILIKCIDKMKIIQTLNPRVDFVKNSSYKILYKKDWIVYRQLALQIHRLSLSPNFLLCTPILEYAIILFLQFLTAVGVSSD